MTVRKRGRGRPRSGKKGFTIKLTLEADQLLHEEAAKADISRSDYVEQAIHLKARYDKMTAKASAQTA
jgi:hypothetical protein